MLGEEMDMVKVIVVDYSLVGWRALKSILLTFDAWACHLVKYEA